MANKIVKTSLREAYQGLNLYMKRVFFRSLSERFPNVKQSTVYNWLKEMAATTPEPEVCEWIAEFFHADIDVMFPYYQEKKKAKEASCEQQ